MPNETRDDSQRQNAYVPAKSTTMRVILGPSRQLTLVLIGLVVTSGSVLACSGARGCLDDLILGG